MLAHFHPPGAHRFTVLLLHFTSLPHPSILNKEEPYEAVYMVQEGDLCTTCGVGTMHTTSYRVDKGLVEAPYRTEGQETGFQCDNPDCGAKWNVVSRTFASKYNLESRNPKKHDTKPKAATKGGMKRMKNTAKPRRQSPR